MPEPKRECQRSIRSGPRAPPATLEQRRCHRSEHRPIQARYLPRLLFFFLTSPVDRRMIAHASTGSRAADLRRHPTSPQVGRSTQRRRSTGIEARSCSPPKTMRAFGALTRSRDPANAARRPEPPHASVRARIPPDPRRRLRTRRVPRVALLAATRSRSPDRRGRVPPCPDTRHEVHRRSPSSRGESDLPEDRYRPRRTLSSPSSSDAARGESGARLRASQRAKALASKIRMSSARAAR